jgi:hypothetical protein
MTEDSKALKRFPLIDDDMVKRFIGAGGCYQRGKSVDQCVREGLEAALDRRTGPKCRRIERDYDAANALQEGRLFKAGRDLGSNGRRSDDPDWTALPSKSSRLAREAAEKAEEIPVTQAMIEAARKGYWAAVNDGHAGDDAYAASIREAERVRREEETAKQVETGCQTGCGQGAPCGASIASPQGGWLHKRCSDTGTAVGDMHRHIRAGERCWARSHRRKDDPT